jgi:hypothetical protein
MSCLLRRAVGCLGLCAFALAAMASADEPAKSQGTEISKAKEGDVATGKVADAPKAKEGDAAKAAPNDTIKVKLDKAKAAYEAEAKKQRDALVESFQKKEESAARAGDKKLRDQVRNERERFEAKNALPEVIPSGEYRWRMRQANMTLEAAYKSALKDYLIAKKDYDAEAIDKELAEFKKKTTTPATPEVWVGVTEFKMTRIPNRLEIVSVDGDSFSGQYYLLFADGTVKGRDRVDGKIEKGRISFRHVNADSGILPSVAVAVISGNRMEGTWEAIQGGNKGTFSMMLETTKK